jgi:hypothetical protein
MRWADVAVGSMSQGDRADLDVLMAFIARVLPAAIHRFIGSLDSDLPWSDPALTRQ